MNTTTRTPLRAAALLAAALSGTGAFASPAHAEADARATLVDLVNAYRAAPQDCEGRRMASVAPLTPHPALARVQVGVGTFLELALERAGYPVERADAISISGPRDAQAAMEAIVPKYCAALLSAQFLAIGVALAGAARAHSEEMAAQHYFSHRGKDGGTAAERATQAGYRWQGIGENIAVGQESADDAVAGWLSSPGHCANLMKAGFSDMGAAFALTSGAGRPRAYWTQVFGKPR